MFTDQIPLSTLSYIMKDCVPDELKISKESKECMQECVKELIMFLTQEASEICKAAHKNTITGEDLIAAMEALGFNEHYTYLMKVMLFGKVNTIDSDGLHKQGNTRKRAKTNAGTKATKTAKVTKATKINKTKTSKT